MAEPSTANGTRSAAAGSGPAKKRIGTLTAFLLVGTALVIDAGQFIINFIPVIGQGLSFFGSFFALALFGVWFLLLGVNYFEGRKAGVKIAASMGGAVAEMMPFISALPALTVSVTLIIMASRLEDVAAPRLAAVPKRRSVPRWSTAKVPPPDAANDNHQTAEREAA